MFDLVISASSFLAINTVTKDWLVKNNIARTVSIGSSLKFCLVASGENNNLIVEINEKEKEMQVNYLNIYEKAKNLLLQ